MYLFLYVQYRHPWVLYSTQWPHWCNKMNFTNAPDDVSVCVLVCEGVLWVVAEFGEVRQARVLDHRGRATHHDQHVIGWRRKVSFQHWSVHKSCAVLPTWGINRNKNTEILKVLLTKRGYIVYVWLYLVYLMNSFSRFFVHVNRRAAANHLPPTEWTW